MKLELLKALTDIGYEISDYDIFGDRGADGGYIIHRGNRVISYHETIHEARAELARLGPEGYG